ncbi:hypothetical protein MPTK2_3g24380 [Marchantia polymorpha subsp. ruderalis]
MDKLLSSSLCDSESLDWTQSEVQYQNNMSFVGDSQFPMSASICLDSQVIEDKCVSQYPLFPAVFPDSIETTASLDMGRWDLAAGEAKSQASADHPEAVMCPPPSLDTQEFEIRFARSDHLSSLECESIERSSLGRWDFADGEAISQALIRPLREAETPPCPQASLETQEFERRCVEPVGKTSVNYLDTPMNSSPNTSGFSDSGDIKDSPRSLSNFFVGENNTLRSPAALDDHEHNLEVGFNRQSDLLSLKSLEHAELTRGQQKSQIPLDEFHNDTRKQPRLVHSRTHQEAPSPWVDSKDLSAVQPIASLDLAENNSSKVSPFLNRSESHSQRNDVEDNADISKDGLVNCKSSDSAEHIGHETKTGFPLLHSQDLVTTTESQVAVGSAGISAGLLDVPVFDRTTEKHSIVNGRIKKRKNQNLPLSRDDMRSPTTPTRSVIKLGRILGGNTAPCRSPLRPLRLSSSIVTDEKYGRVTEAKQSYELKGVKIEAECLENLARAAVREIFPSEQTYPTGKENVGCHRTLKQLDAAMSATFKTIKRELQSDNGPKQITLLVTSTIGKSHSSVKTQSSSPVGSNSHHAKAKVPEDHEQTQEWRCPQASKRLLYNKPRQRSLDGWLK